MKAQQIIKKRLLDYLQGIETAATVRSTVTAGFIIRLPTRNWNINTHQKSRETMQIIRLPTRNWNALSRINAVFVTQHTIPPFKIQIKIA